MRPLDVVPLAYWLRTRCGRPYIGWLAFYVLTTLGYLSCILVYAAPVPEQAPAPVLLLVAWVLYLSVHEIGYFVNDLWSQKREHARGINLSKALADRPDPRLLAAAVASRVAAAVGLLLVLYPAVDRAAFVCITAVVACLFAAFWAHNAVFYPHRVLTFFLLYLGRYLLVVPFVWRRLDPWAIAVSVTAPAFGFTLAYAIRKRVIPISLAWLDSGSCFILRGSSAFLAVGALASFIAGRGDLRLPVLLIGYSIGIDLAFVFARVVAGLARSLARGDERCHVHTCFSHDGELSPAAVATQAASQGVSTVYVTDHAETFSAGKYQDLKAALAEASLAQRCHLVAGLEYSILGQHFLAINLREYVEVDPNSVQGLERIRRACDRVVWAHPLFAIRRVFLEGKYRAQLLQMMASVDGIEWVNLKSLRPYRNVWRHALICLTAIALFGRKTLPRTG
jgi:PHP domain